MKIKNTVGRHSANTRNTYSTWARSAEQLESSLRPGIAALDAFNRAVVGFRERLAIILGLLRIKRSTLKLESRELGGSFVHVP